MSEFDTATVRERKDGVKQVTVPSDLDVSEGDKLILAPFEHYTVVKYGRFGSLQHKANTLDKIKKTTSTIDPEKLEKVEE